MDGLNAGDLRRVEDIEGWNAPIAMKFIMHTVSALLAIFAGFALFSFDRAGQPLIEFIRQQAVKDSITAGGDLVVLYRINLLRFCPFTSYRSIVDGANAITELATTRDFDREPSSILVQLPASLAPGQAFYRVTRIYHCPWLLNFETRDVEISLPDLPFTILPQLTPERS